MLRPEYFEEGFDFHPIIRDIISKIHTEGPVDGSSMETLAFIKEQHPDMLNGAEATLLSTMGLFYKTGEPKNLFDLVYSLFSVSIEEVIGKKYTPIQSDAYVSIMDNAIFSFSAPTSTGKSFLFQQLIGGVDGDAIIVVPSRALLAEYIDKIASNTGNDVLVLPFIEIVNTKHTRKKIFVITPERGNELFKHIDRTNVQLFLFDEAQLTEDGIRGMKFDSFVRRVNKKYPQIKKVFAHPFIENPEAQIGKNNLGDGVAKKYEQNTVGKLFLTHKNGRFFYFSPYDMEHGEVAEYHGDVVYDVIKRGGSCLFYVSKTSIYDSAIERDFEPYIRLCREIRSPEALKLVDELNTYFGTTSRKRSQLVEYMKRGIVIHHGSIPLKARFIIEKFVNMGFAKLCFSTSTLIQGINMPFDLVWVHYNRFSGNPNKAALDLKNLIGRAGRMSKTKDCFDYGYVVIEAGSLSSFKKRFNDKPYISAISLLDSNNEEYSSDYQDEVDAIVNDTFNDNLNLTQVQVDRLVNSDNGVWIEFILDNLMPNGKPTTASVYYKIDNDIRKEIKNAFQHIYISQLRRHNLTVAEKSILSTAIPILLWKIQGKSFAEIVSLRYSFISRRDERRALRKQLRDGKISEKEYQRMLMGLTARYTCQAQQLPNMKARTVTLFKNENVLNLEYDLMIYDTYDYLDKVISLSLKDPLCAAFKLYFEETGDVRANAFSNYIAYGTDDEMEIWLQKYGFEFEDIEWLKPCIDTISDEEIVFNNLINKEIKDEEKYEVVKRYLNE